MRKELRCYAEFRDGTWEAICVDLDIAVQGDAFDSARDSLHKAIDLYLERIAELPPDEQRVFLDRRSPWHLRAKFVFYSLYHRMFGRDRDGLHAFTLSGALPA